MTVVEAAQELDVDLFTNGVTLRPGGKLQKLREALARVLKDERENTTDES